MLIIPAIDIRNGRCVRLTRGEFTSEKVYSADPVSIAKKWETLGAQMLHIVDLDGAKNGAPFNSEVIKTLAASVRIPIQVGGGIRNKKAVEKLLSIGLSRVVLGTVALENKEELKSILNDFSSQVAVALDTKDGTLMRDGWLAASDKNIMETALELERFGVQRFIYTDVAKDGTLTEPSYEEIATLTKNLAVPIIASGGISSVDAVKQLKTLGIEGVIIGKALYEKQINLREVLSVS